MLTSTRASLFDSLDPLFGTRADNGPGSRLLLSEVVVDIPTAPLGCVADCFVLGRPLRLNRFRKGSDDSFAISADV